MNAWHRIIRGAIRPYARGYGILGAAKGGSTYLYGYSDSGVGCYYRPPFSARALYSLARLRIKALISSLFIGNGRLTTLVLL